MISNRRSFIKKLGYVSVGFSLMGAACTRTKTSGGKNDIQRFGPKPDNNLIDSWLQILENGEIRILTGKIELGQGIGTALMQIAAEELNTKLDLIEITLVETGVTPDEGYTVGSVSIQSSGMSIRNAAAAAREVLLEMASTKWNVPISSITLKNGHINSSKEDISLFELLEGRQINTEVFQPKEIRSKTIRNYVGKPLHRKDIEDMVRGKPVFIQDLRFPNMVHARVIRPTAYTAKLIAIDNSELSKMAGFIKFVQIGSFLGVLTKEEYQAIKLKSKATMLCQWANEENLPEVGFLKDYLLNLPVETEKIEEKGSFRNSIEQSFKQYSASYYKPYIMHGANGPSCAIAFYSDGKLDVWTHSQGIYPLRKSLALLLKLPENDIHIKGVPASGCYGHNGADDAAAEAAIMATQYPDKHIRLQWMRDDEHGWEPYGTAMVMKLKAGLSESGQITGWKYDFWTDGHGTRPGRSPESLLPARFLEKGYPVPGYGFKYGAVRNSVPYYKIEHFDIQAHFFHGPLRQSGLRSLGAYANVFAIESFMDELAVSVKIDSLKFRIKHLEDGRAIDCLKRLQENTSKIKKKENEGIGYAFARYSNSSSYIAIATLVKVNRRKKLIVKKMWAVVDSGEVINPDGLKNQIEGGMIQSTSWTLLEKVHFDKKHISSLDWNSYPVLRFMESPEIHVDIIERNELEPLGVGEAAQGPVAASITNAIYNACKVRVRELPIKSNSLFKL
ncbi:molybdopterin cofactor-binding domain-containing protein [Maribacter sp. X9]|uniref:xanthine dehydrogenase family protein molybdopterin-binding subunit n=1 Tax=Maribacter sp. X9 TaxID=3402159 RepID=UPI003AF34300